MKNKYFLLPIAGLLLASGYFLVSQNATRTVKTTTMPAPQKEAAMSDKPDGIDYSASFAIFTHGTFRIFTDPKYHRQSEDIYIQADNPNIIHVKKSEITWDDFFKTLPMKLTKDCLTTGTGQVFCSGTDGKLRFYINSKEDPNALSKQIGDGDKLLVTYGNENDQQIKEQLQKIPVVK